MRKQLELAISFGQKKEMQDTPTVINAEKTRSC